MHRGRRMLMAKSKEGNAMAARLRHIAMSVSDTEKAAKFFEDAFGMKRVGKAGIGCYVSDGTINVALLKYEDEVSGFPKGYCGLIHFGMWVDNLEEATKKVTDAGASYFCSRPAAQPTSSGASSCRSCPSDLVSSSSSRTSPAPAAISA